MFQRVAPFALMAIVFIAGSASSQAAPAKSRDSMETCAVRVITRLSKAKATEDKVGPAVVKECDKQLRAALAEAVKSGEAGGCTVESCLDLARERASEEAVEKFKATPTP